MTIKMRKEKLTYSNVPDHYLVYTKKMDKIYTRYAKAYDCFMAVFPLWKKWLRSVLPYLQGDRILEVSFGPAYLLTQYPKDKMLFGLDYNAVMVKRAKEKMEKCNQTVDIVKGDVTDMPYPDGFFDTIVNTMAFTGYPDGQMALAEMLRVLKPDGVLLMLDYDYPKNRNVWGCYFVKLIEKCGDIIKDIGALIESNGCDYQRKIIGGFGSVQLFIIKKQGEQKQ